jgi:hypothetical protein
LWPSFPTQANATCPRNCSENKPARHWRNANVQAECKKIKAGGGKTIAAARLFAQKATVRAVFLFAADFSSCFDPKARRITGWPAFCAALCQRYEKLKTETQNVEALKRTAEQIARCGKADMERAKERKRGHEIRRRDRNKGNGFRSPCCSPNLTARRL